uniref:Uncharacterized protein n=1 Tax=Plectus sambesii TaxID=2011161 RepID=A0A914XMP9_9BILA
MRRSRIFEVGLVHGPVQANTKYRGPRSTVRLEHCAEFKKQQGFADVSDSVSVELHRRFSYVLNPTYPSFQAIFAVTTLLDPSLCSLLLLNPNLLAAAKSEVSRLLRLLDLPFGVDSDMQASSESPAADLLAPSNSKFQRLFSKLAEQGGHGEKSVSSVVDYEMELKEYLAMPAFNVDRLSVHLIFALFA